MRLLRPSRESFGVDNMDRDCPEVAESGVSCCPLTNAVSGIRVIGIWYAKPWRARLCFS